MGALGFEKVSVNGEPFTGRLVYEAEHRRAELIVEAGRVISSKEDNDNLRNEPDSLSLSRRTPIGNIWLNDVKQDMIDVVDEPLPGRRSLSHVIFRLKTGEILLEMNDDN